MAFASFMSSAAGRILRIVAGLALIGGGVYLIVAASNVTVGIILVPSPSWDSRFQKLTGAVSIDRPCNKSRGGRDELSLYEPACNSPSLTLMVICWLPR
jgi:hypothetical protein